MNDNYTRLAKKKIAFLIRKDDFKMIESITESYISIEFEKNRCTIDIFGKVEWFDKHELN